MKLDNLEIFITRNKTPGKGGKYFIFVKLITKCGVIGYGEVYAAAVHPQTMKAVIVDVFQRHMHNENPQNIEIMFRRAYSSGFSQRPDPTIIGAFSGLDKVIAKRGSDTSIGFGAKVKHFQDQSSGDLIKNLEPEDLIKYGLIPEFVGRMPILATLEELDENSLVKILQEPKNSLIKQYKRLFEFENVKLIFKKEAVVEIAKKAISKKTGARGLRSIIEALLLKTMFKLPAMEDVEEVVINQSVVKNNSDPLIIHAKNKKTSAA